MPLKLNIGLSQKIGLPQYGSLGASCHVEVELDQALLAGDPDSFQQKVRQAFGACRQAVQEELGRHSRAGPQDKPSYLRGSKGHASPANGNGRASSQPRDQTRRATASQVRAIEAIANRQHIDLAARLCERFGTDKATDLSITEASNLIDELKASVNSNGGGR